MNKRIHQAIENTHAGLKPNEFLADKIIAEQHHRQDEKRKGGYWLSLPQKAKNIVVFALVLMLFTVTAFALMRPMRAMDDGGVWTYEEGKLMFQRSGAKRPQVVLENDSIVAMAADVDMPGTLYYVTWSEEGQRLLSTTSYGLPMTPGRDLDSSFNITDMVATGGRVYAVVNNKQIRNSVYSISVRPDQAEYDAALHIEGWTNKRVSNLSLHGDVLFAYRETGELAAINFRTLELFCPPVKVKGLLEIVAGFEKDGDQYAFVINEEGRLMILNARTGEMFYSGQRIDKNTESMSRDETNLYTYDFDGKQTGCFNILQLSGKKVDHLLTIVDGPHLEEPSMAIAIEMFNEKYPNVEVVRRDILDNRVLATEMMADEGGVDVFAMQGMYGMTPAPGLLANGAIIDLTDMPEMQALRDDYRDIWGLMSTHGRQYGVLWETGVELFQVNPKLAEAVGWEIPTGVWTWEDFDALADKVYAYNQTAERPIYLAGENVLTNMRWQYEATHTDYYLGTADFQTAEYLALLERIQDLSVRGLIYIKDPHDLSFDMPDNTLLWAEEHALGKLGNDTYVLPPVYDIENPLFLVDSWCLMANANSRYPEEAAYFLACYASVEATSNQFYLNCGQWLKDKSLYGEQHDMRTPPSAQNEYLYNFVLEHGVPQLRDLELMRLQITEGLLEMLMNGDITPQEYADTMQQKADMLIGG